MDLIHRFCFHLINIPIGHKQTCIYDFDICSYAFNFLCVPGGKVSLSPMVNKIFGSQDSK
jgi:hypothetical protein